MRKQLRALRNMRGNEVLAFKETIQGKADDRIAEEAIILQ